VPRLPLPIKDPSRAGMLPARGSPEMSNLAVLVAVVAALYFGRDIFVLEVPADPPPDQGRTALASHRSRL
jgi:hypothetical protein